MTILVGTASWTDKSLLDSGRFYPPDAKSAEARLRYYASQFPLVEVDSSYYAIPAATVTDQWVQRTPDGFIFNVKGFRALTGHQFQPKVLPKYLQEALKAPPNKNFYYRDLPTEIQDEMWRLFFEAVAPLRKAGKLGALHWQFAPWVVSGGPDRKFVEDCVERLDGWLMAIEFRNISWWTDWNLGSTLAYEREHGLVNVVVDAPPGLPNSMPEVWEVTNPKLAVVRLHGRNADTWNQRGLTAASERFNYDYPDRELAEIAEKVAGLTRQAQTIHVVLNVNYQDQGQRNARTLTRMLREEGRS